MIETFNDTDKVLVRYLFNELAEAERRELEDEMLLNDELFDRVQVVEMNLIDGYVRDEMNAEENLRFKEKFLAIPENSDKVNHAQMFHNSLQHLHEKEPLVTPTVVREQGWRQWTAGLFQRPLPALTLTALALFLTFAGLYGVYLNQRLAANSNTVVANSPPTVPSNVNIATNTPSNSSVPVNAPTPRQKPPVLSSTQKVTGDSRVEIARNNPKGYTQDFCLFCQDQRSAERSGSDPIPITLDKKTTHLKLRYELLEDVRERELFNVTIKNRYADPIKLKNGEDKQAVKLVFSKGRKRRRFIIINVPTSLFKDSGPYTFEIDEPNFSPRTFTINK